MKIVSLLLLALSASAHEGYPIKPVSVRLEVEADRIAADIETDSIFWIEEVAHLHPMPPTDWPADARARVQDYMNAHLRLTYGGLLRHGTLDSARYRQLPWEVNEEGTFFLRMIYPPAPAGDFTVSASFFEEYRAEMAGEYGNRPLPYAADYKTVVSLPGKSVTLTPQSPWATLKTEEARRGALSSALMSLRAGASAALGTAAGFPALLAVALCVGGAFKRRDAVLLTAAAATGFLCVWIMSWTPPWQIWLWTLLAAVFAGRWRAASSVAIATAWSVGLAWAIAARAVLPHTALAQPAALIGALAGGALLLAAMLLFLREEHKRMYELSESRVEELFARRVRLTGTVLAMVGAYGLWQSFQR